MLVEWGRSSLASFVVAQCEGGGEHISAWERFWLPCPVAELGTLLGLAGLVVAVWVAGEAGGR